MRGVLVAAHGSRSPEVEETMQFIMKNVRERVSEVPVQLGYLGVGFPSIEEGLEMLRQLGVIEITILPYFLFQGIHVKETLPEIAEAFEKQHPEVHVSVEKSLGADVRLAELLAERIRSVDTTNFS